MQWFEMIPGIVDQMGQLNPDGPMRQHMNGGTNSTLLWVIIGLLFVIEHTGAQWAKDWFSKTYAYVQDKFPLRIHGYALWDLWPDRKITFVEHYPRIGNFHHPRHLMLNLLSIERMIKRNGKVSGDLS